MPAGDNLGVRNQLEQYPGESVEDGQCEIYCDILTISMDGDGRQIYHPTLGPHIGRLLKCENVDLESVMVVEPIVIVNGMKAGEK